MNRRIAAPAASALALVFALWASTDLAAFHIRRNLPPAAQGTNRAPTSIVAHDASHLCALALPAHVAHGLPLTPNAAPLVADEPVAATIDQPRPVPGRTASGLAPPA